MDSEVSEADTLIASGVSIFGENLCCFVSLAETYLEYLDHESLKKEILQVPNNNGKL